MASATGTGTVTYNALTTEQRTFYELTMLERAVPNFLYCWFGMEGSVWPVTTLPENQGNQVQWNKLTAFTAVTTAIDEGVTPNPQDITVTNTTGTVNSYGAYIRYTRTLSEFGIHKIAQEASDALGEQAGDSLDQITRATVVATGSEQFANGRATEAAIVNGDNLTFTEIMKGVTTLKTNKAKEPMDGKFPAALHPKAVYDLYTDPVFQAMLSYSDSRGDENRWIRGYIGNAFGVSFFETPNGYSLSNGTVTVYYTSLFGKGSFGVGGLAAYMPTVIRETQDHSNHTFENVRPLRLIDKPFGSTGTADPFDRLASIAWYTTYVVQVLDTNFLLHIKHDVQL